MSPSERYQVQVDVRITDRESGYGALAISETCTVGGGTFLELAGILGQFHEVFERIKAQKANHVTASWPTPCPTNPVPHMWNPGCGPAGE